MNEFVTVSSSSYDPANLASQLTEKSAQGWVVVAIVPTGGDVTAFLSRESSGADAAMSSDTSNSTSGMGMASSEPAAPMMAAAEPASEPDGWAVAPAAAAEPAPYSPAPSSAPATVIQSSFNPVGDSYSPAPSYQPQPAPAAATPAVPAGWYADPAGRYELRYWDGGTWTEHVSRAGQQFTDAPVA
ncbi:MAG: DUF2510 domain-containing protein [Ilumatobacteraceae bacterium]